MFIINEMPAKVEPATVERASFAEPATIGHFRIMGFPRKTIRPLHDCGRRVGTAVTLALPGADSTLLHHAVAMLREGDVLVIDRLGDDTHACLGGGVAYAIANRGVAAVIIDGPIADPGEIREIGLPVWASGVSSVTTRLLGAGGVMNAQISCGGAVVRPGDLVIADEGGVVFLPSPEADSDIERAMAMQEMEKRGLGSMGPNAALGELTGATALVQAKLQA
ncbi:RraA family protein [Paraburkholderia sp. J63]|uniref:RraA family protein n=1 Tax=Paraburkholderia sp. J63 TaxID=2805434 RepID=UPI002ABDF48F|nr:RraA family protein [Paraburkholderia sp. J63]